VNIKKEREGGEGEGGGKRSSRVKERQGEKQD